MGSKIATVPATYSTIFATIMPFLYQTRTMADLCMTMRVPRKGIRSPDTIIRRDFSCSSRRPGYSTNRGKDSYGQADRPVSWRSVNLDGVEPRADTPWRNNGEPKNSRPDSSRHGTRGGKDKLKIRRTTSMHGMEPQPDAHWVFDPERTTTQARPADAAWQSSIDEGGSGYNDFVGNRWEGLDEAEELDLMKSSTPNFIDFEEDVDKEFAESSQLNDIADLTDPRKALDSTITVAERFAFQKIFSDIFARSRQDSEQRSRETRPEDVLGGERRDITGEAPQPQKAKAKMKNIMITALEKPSATQTREEKRIAVNRYPPALQAAAARAFGLYDNEGQLCETSDWEARLDTDQLEELREPERARVEGLMRAANTDFELWDIMEKEVFSLIAKLGLEDSPKKEEAPKKDVVTGKGGKKSKGSTWWKNETDMSDNGQNSAQPENSTELPTSENAISPLSLYGPLYPSYVLLGLRLLDRSFARPSPLALSVLPKIKSLGLISHVLGASTQLYNELIEIYRHRQDDYRGILNLLTEMERFGLELDKETYEIVTDIMKKQVGVLRGEKGAALKVLWTLPEFAPHRFRVWRDKIQSVMREKEPSSGISG